MLHLTEKVVLISSIDVAKGFCINSRILLVGF